MKRIITLTLIALLSSQAQAGFWDTVTGFFAGSEDNKEETLEKETSDSNMLAQTVQLIPLLTQSLGVNESQASGGMGALLQAAQSLLAGSDYSQLLAAIPNASKLLAAAPTLTDSDKGTGGDLLSGAMDKMAEHSETAGTAKQLLSQFKSLGLGADKVPQFTDVTGKFLQQTDHAAESDMLTKALSSLF